MAITQDSRHLKIETPLGADHLLLESFSVTEAISELYEIDLELLHEEPDEGYTPTSIDVPSILGQPVSIAVSQADGTSRFFHGIVRQFSQGTRHVRFSFYRAVVVPQVWLLTQNRQSRIFQHKSVPDILRVVFVGFNVKYELQGTFEPRNYCVQYRETDWDFAARLMEEEGIYFYFVHTDSEHSLIVANSPSSHRDCPSKNAIPYFHKVDEQDLVTAIHRWSTDNTLMTGKYVMWDHNFQLPGNKLDVTQPSRNNVGGNSNLEIYDFPGGYAKQFDGVDKSGGERSDVNKVYGKRASVGENTMEALDARYELGHGAGDCSSMTAGHRFTMSNHPNSGLNRAYVVTRVTHNARQSPTYVSDEVVSDPYTNAFTALALGEGKPTFRPMRTIEKPVLYGSQTAQVVGPSGEEIFTDKFGRVKVQFHWDRDGKHDADSSCWIRVAQPWAGNKWGMMFIPRIGMEVVVHFLEGDPDQPIITGCVYNPEMMPPYTLPDEKTKSTMKSNSSKGGQGFNEIRFEDKKGSEQVFMHAEKNLDIRVKNDRKENVGNDHHLIVGNDKYEKVDKDVHLVVAGNVNQKLGDTLSIKATSDIHQKADSNVALEAGMGMHINGGMTTVIEAGTSLTLKVGGNFINIGPAGVFISGTMVMINSGGAAGSGSGCSPEAPKDPKEADTANPGDRPASPKALPPKPAKSYSPMAVVMKNAAKNGTPFCEICSKG